MTPLIESPRTARAKTSRPIVVSGRRISKSGRIDGTLGAESVRSRIRRHGVGSYRCALACDSACDGPWQSDRQTGKSTSRATLSGQRRSSHTIARVGTRGPVSTHRAPGVAVRSVAGLDIWPSYPPWCERRSRTSHDGVIEIRHVARADWSSRRSARNVDSWSWFATTGRCSCRCRSRMRDRLSSARVEVTVRGTGERHRVTTVLRRDDRRSSDVSARTIVSTPATLCHTVTDVDRRARNARSRRWLSLSGVGMHPSARLSGRRVDRLLHVVGDAELDDPEQEQRQDRHDERELDQRCAPVLRSRSSSPHVQLPSAPGTLVPDLRGCPILPTGSSSPEPSSLSSRVPPVTPLRRNRTTRCVRDRVGAGKYRRFRIARNVRNLRLRTPAPRRPRA